MKCKFCQTKTDDEFCPECRTIMESMAIQRGKSVNEVQEMWRSVNLPPRLWVAYETAAIRIRKKTGKDLSWTDLIREAAEEYLKKIL